MKDTIATLRQLCMVIGVIVLVLGIAFTLADALPYIFSDGAYADFFGETDPTSSRKAILLAHVVPGILALATGSVQVLGGFRRLHRAIGIIYVVSVLVSGVSSIALSPYALSGPVAGAGFASLGFAWLLATLIGLVAQQLGRRVDHRAWMLRSFALTCAAVIFRIELLLLNSAFGMSFMLAYDIAAWASWVPLIVLVEAWLRANKVQ